MTHKIFLKLSFCISAGHLIGARAFSVRVYNNSRGGFSIHIFPRTWWFSEVFCELIVESFARYQQQFSVQKMALKMALILLFVAILSAHYLEAAVLHKVSFITIIIFATSWWECFNNSSLFIGSMITILRNANKTVLKTCKYVISFNSGYCKQTSLLD